jgi:hypothetical protein
MNAPSSESGASTRACSRRTPTFVVTNQAGVADGSLTRQELNGYLTQLSDEFGGAITAWAACTHPRTAGGPASSGASPSPTPSISVARPWSATVLLINNSPRPPG